MLNLAIQFFRLTCTTLSFVVAFIAAACALVLALPALLVALIGFGGFVILFGWGRDRPNAELRSYFDRTADLIVIDPHRNNRHT